MTTRNGRTSFARLVDQIRDEYRSNPSWRRVGALHGVSGATARRMSLGYEPRTSGIRAALGLPIMVTVYARGVRAGAVVLGRSRRCAWRKCRVHFVTDTNRVYCCHECARLANAEQRRQRTERHRERARRMAARRRNEKRR
jgi:hypothetical protein